MKTWKWLAVLSVLLGGTAAAQLPTCTVTGTLYHADGSRFAGGQLIVTRTEVPGYVTSTQEVPFKADVNGNITLTLPRNANVWLYGPAVAGYDSTRGIRGVKRYVPNTATATLLSLNIGSLSMPSQIIGGLVYVMFDSTKRADTLKFAGGAIASVDWIFNTATITVSGGSGDTTGVKDGMLKRLADDMAAKRDADSTNIKDKQQADSILTANNNALQALADAQTALTRARIDSIYFASGALDISDAMVIQPDVVIQTAPDVFVDLPDMGTIADGWRLLYVNESGGNGLIRYANISDDPDNSGSGQDTVATWQMHIIAGNVWRVVRPGSGTVFDTALVSAMLDAAAIRPSAFSNEQTLRTNQYAAWRDTSRTWRTFVTPTDTCVLIDSSTAGKYVVSFNPNCRTDQLAALVAAAQADTNCTMVMYNAITRRFELTCDDAGGASIPVDSLTFYRASGTRTIRPATVGSSDYVVFDSLRTDGPVTIAGVATFNSAPVVSMNDASHTLSTGAGEYVVNTPYCDMRVGAYSTAGAYIHTGPDWTTPFHSTPSYADLHICKGNPNAGRVDTAGASIVNLSSRRRVMNIFTAQRQHRVNIGGGLKADTVYSAYNVTAGDTIRSGTYDVYSYFIPGGALVQSSTREIKRNIVPVDTLPALLERFMSVDPVRYQFRPSAFRQGFDTSYASGQWYTMTTVQRKAFRDSCSRADSVRAESLASKQMIGFLSEDLYAAGFSSDMTHIDQGELIATLWRVTQRLVVRVRDLDKRIDAIEKRLKAGGL